MKKSGIFLFIFLFLLGFSIVPVGSDIVASQGYPEVAATEASMPSTRTMVIRVAEDVAVVNGSEADTNFLGSDLFVGTGDDVTEWLIGRSFFRFDLTNVPSELAIQSATMNVYLTSEYTPGNEPVGAYYCANDSWDASTITWNNQPSFSGVYTDIIDSPASPDMFIPMNWYSWDITSDVLQTIQGDKILTEILKQTVEIHTQNAFLYFASHVLSEFYDAYLELTYRVPSTSELTVEGIASGTQLDYINNPCPELGWIFADPDVGDFQKDYDVEVWDNEHYNGSMLWDASHESISWIHNSFGDLPPGNSHPFGFVDNEFRMQMKYPASELSRSGVVDKLYFVVAHGEGLLQLENLEISLTQVPSTAALTTDFAANFETRTPTVVLSADLYETTVDGDLIEIDVEDTFFSNEYMSLIIELRFTDNTGDMFRLNRTTSGGPGSVAYVYGADASVNPTASLTYDRTYDLRLGYLTESVFEDPMGSYNGFPFGVTSGTAGRFQVKWNRSYINRAGYIDKAYFRVSSISGEPAFENLTISLAETPVEGPIDHEDWESNYGGATPTVVLDESYYTVTNLGHALVIDFSNDFYYSNTNDLLIDFQWDARVGDSIILNYLPGSTTSYRAWDVHWNGLPRLDNGTAGYDLLLDFVNSENSVPLEGCVTLVNATRYYWRARTCDSTGIWSDWTTASFKYEVLTSTPTFTTPVAVPSSVLIGEDVTVSLNVTYSLGISSVVIEYDGANHTMTAVGDTYSYTWAPSTAGTVNYVIYMESNANTWSSVAGSFDVLAPPSGGGLPTTLLLIGGAVAVVIVVVVIVLLKRKPAR